MIRHFCGHLPAVLRPQAALEHRQALPATADIPKPNSAAQVAQRGDLAIQQVGQHLEMALDPPAAPVGVAAVDRRDILGQVGHQDDLRLPLPRRLVQFQDDQPQAMRRPGRLGIVHEDRLLVDLAGRAAPPRLPRPGWLVGQRRLVPPCQEGPASSRDAEQEGADAQVAVEYPQLAGRDGDFLEQVALLGVGILLQDQIGDQAAGRLVDRQRLAGQTGRPGGPRRGQAMVGPGQDVAVEDAGTVAGDRLRQQAPAAFDQGAAADRRVADDRGGDGRAQAIELAVSGLIPSGITAGPDGNLWFTESGAIGKIDPATGVITQFPIAPVTFGTLLEDGVITTGPDGNLWFGYVNGDELGMINPTTDAITQYPVPLAQPLLIAIGGPAGITAGPDGDIWITLETANEIGAFNPQTLSLAPVTPTVPGTLITPARPGRPFGFSVTLDEGPGQAGAASGGTITLALANDPGGATLTVTTPDGVDTFAGLTLKKLADGEGYKLIDHGGRRSASPKGPADVKGRRPVRIGTEAALTAGKGKDKHVVGFEIDLAKVSFHAPTLVRV